METKKSNENLQRINKIKLNREIFTLAEFEQIKERKILLDKIDLVFKQQTQTEFGISISVNYDLAYDCCCFFSHLI